VDKVVRFFLFEYRAGDVADHDHEIEDARWMPLEEAARSLTYEGEREMVSRAMSRYGADR
jgi:NADH pyrophosphatase NudC (nudix superfamily)